MDDAYERFGILLYLLYLDQVVYKNVDFSEDYGRYNRVANAMCTYVSSSRKSYSILNICAASYVLCSEQPIEDVLVTVRNATRKYTHHTTDAYVYLDPETSIALNSMEGTPTPPLLLNNHDVKSVTRGRRLGQKDRGQRTERCRNGYRRVPIKTGKCLHRITNEPQSLQVEPHIERPTPNITQRSGRCPNGSHRIPAKTGDCVAIHVSGGRRVNRLFSAQELSQISTISIEKTMDEIIKYNGKTACELLSEAYSTYTTPPAPIPEKKRRGRPPIIVTKVSPSILSRNQCIWIALMTVVFPAFNQLKQSDIAATMLYLSGEIPRTELRKSTVQCAKTMQSMLPVLLTIRPPQY